MASLPHAAAPLAADLGAFLPDRMLAYIGPGAGLGAILLTVALALGALLLVMGLVWYPLKRLLKARAGDDVPDGPGDGPA